MTTSFDNAAQVLTPPEPGLPYLRTNRAGELTLDPGGLTADDDGRIAIARTHRRRGRPRRRHRLRAPPRTGRLPHPPAVRRLARPGVRHEGHRRAIRRDREIRRRHRVVRPRAARDARRRGPPAGPRARRPRCSSTARPRSNASPATGSRARASCGHSSWPRSWADPSSSQPPAPPSSPTPSQTGYTRRHLDGRGRGDDPGSRRVRHRARHLRRVDRVQPRAPRPHGRAGHGEQPDPPRPRRAVLDHALRPCGPRAQRPLARPPLGHPPRRHRAAGQIDHRRRAAPRRRVHGRRGHRAGTRPDRRPARSSSSPPTPTRAPRRSSRCR